MLRVLLADDHAPTRDDIRRALERDPRFEVCAEAADAAAAVEAAVRERPDLCVLDIAMPGGGVAATWEIAARLPQTKIVMLTVSSDDAHLFASLSAGASSYLLKTIDPRRLPDALHDVWEGKAAIPRELVARMVEQFKSVEPRRRAVLVDVDQSARLTSREWQILELLADDLSTQQIARRLFITRSAVRAHVSAIVRKLEVSDRRGAIAVFRASRARGPDAGEPEGA
jgi:DNA-binding NarL/FixJ family response regulator